MLLKTLTVSALRSISEETTSPSTKTTAIAPQNNSHPCHVYDDGSLDQRVLRYHTLDKPTLKEFLGFESLTIPNYDRVMKFVFDLHRRLPYFDLVGWDIALDVNNEPVFIEMNLTAESGFAQMNGGPLFGKYLDEVMERVSKVHKDYRNSVEMKFENGSRLMMKV